MPASPAPVISQAPTLDSQSGSTLHPPTPNPCNLDSSLALQLIPQDQPSLSHVQFQPYSGTRLGLAGPWLGHGRRRVGRAHTGAQLCCADTHHTHLHSRCQMPGIWPCRSGSCRYARGTHTLGRGEGRAGQRALEGPCPEGKGLRGPQCHLRSLPQARICGWGFRDFKASASFWAPNQSRLWQRVEGVPRGIKTRIPFRHSLGVRGLTNQL